MRTLAHKFARRMPLGGVVVVLLLLTTVIASGVLLPPASVVAISPEEELVQRYAPIAYLSTQESPCDPEAEPYIMAPVDIVYGNADIMLRADPDNAVVSRGIEGSTIHQKDRGYYIDLPGNPRLPTCTYELDAREAMKGYEPTVYAHIAREEGQDGLAIQYWFYWWYNDFNNKHESDWEMIQVLFDVNTVEEALQTDPVEVAFSQHEGGEVARWDAPKLEREGTHPVVYPSRGSHAAYYGPAVWVGWGSKGSGFGCDDTQNIDRHVAPAVVLLPDDPSSINDPNSPYAWLTYQGHWGERGWSFYNGPTGPAMKARWTAPISWQDDLRRSSIALYRGPTIGPATSTVFCTVIGTSSDIVTLFGPKPWLVILMAALVLVVIAVMLTVARRTLVGAWLIYRHAPWVFIRIGLLLAPLTLIGSALRWGMNTSSSLAERLPFDEDNPGVQLVFSLEGPIQTVILLAVVGPMVIWSTKELLSGRQPGFRSSLTAVRPRMLPVLWTQIVLYTFVIILTLTIIGIPFAINRFVRWQFGDQAATLDEVRGRAALRASSSSSKGRWWQIVATLPVLFVLGATIGPLVGIALLLGPKMQIDIANGIGSIIYSVTMPFAVIGMTLLYLAGKPTIEPRTEE